MNLALRISDRARKGNAVYSKTVGLVVRGAPFAVSHRHGSGFRRFQPATWRPRKRGIKPPAPAGPSVRPAAPNLSRFENHEQTRGPLEPAFWFSGTPLILTLAVRAEGNIRCRNYPPGPQNHFVQGADIRLPFRLFFLRGVGLGSSLRVKCLAGAESALRRSPVAVARNLSV